MSHNIYYDNQNNIVFSTWVGPITLQQVKTMNVEILHFCKMHESFKVIIDTRFLEFQETHVDLFNFDIEMNMNPHWRMIKVAVIVSSKESTLSFAYRTARLNGLNINLFKSMGKSLLWLTNGLEKIAQ